MKILFRIFRQQYKRYPATYSFLVVLIALTAGIWIAEPLFASYAINEMLGATRGEEVDYIFLFSAWLGLFFLISAIQTTQKFIGWKVNEWQILDYREAVYRHVLQLGISFHTRQKSGEVVKILDSAADTLADLQRQLFIQLIPSFISAAAFLGIGFTISPILSLVLVASIVLYMCIAVWGTRRTALLQQQVNKFWVESIGRAFDAVTNVFSVKSGSQEGMELGRMHATHEKTLQTQQKVNRRWAAVEAINFFMLTRILLTAIGFYLFTQGKLSLGFVYFFQASFFRVLTPFEMLGSMLPQWNKQVGRVRLAEELLNTPIDVQNTASPVIPKAIKGKITFTNVHFSYTPEKQLNEDDDKKEVTQTETAVKAEEEEQEDVKESIKKEEVDISTSNNEADNLREVLRGIDLDIKPGEHIALVGHSGAGKTTVAMLLNRFYDVTEGSISLDGLDLRELDVHWWRSRIGLVLQDNLMFNDSVLENIRYARPEATDEEVYEAASRAAANEFIEKMPNGYETMIGDRGIRLSGGQRQRVAIARAILKKPDVVILDEATSALDSVTEKTVQEGIKGLIEGRTAVIIAHRLSTVRSVDRIAVMENGKVTAFAPHEELMKTSPIYRQMVKLQREGMLAE